MLDPLGLRTELFWVVPSKYIFSRLETLPVHPPYPGRGRRRKTFHVQNFWEIFPFWPQQSGNSEVIFWPVFTLFASLIRKSAAEDERRSRQTPVTALFSLMHHGSFSLPSHTRYNLESPAWVRSDLGTQTEWTNAAWKLVLSQDQCRKMLQPALDSSKLRTQVCKRKFCCAWHPRWLVEDPLIHLNKVQPFCKLWSSENTTAQVQQWRRIEN